MNTLNSAVLLAVDVDRNTSNVKPGLIGLFFFVLLVGASVLLWRSMNRQMRKVDANFGVTSGPRGPRPLQTTPDNDPVEPGAGTDTTVADAGPDRPKA